jgi:hypothetical protein
MMYVPQDHLAFKLHPWRWPDKAETCNVNATTMQVVEVVYTTVIHTYTHTHTRMCVHTHTHTHTHTYTHIYIYIYIKFTRYAPWKALRGRGGIALLLLNLGIRTRPQREKEKSYASVVDRTPVAQSVASHCTVWANRHIHIYIQVYTYTYIYNHKPGCNMYTSNKLSTCKV